MNQTFRALAERDFRLYFFGQAVSLIGTWVQQVAMSWIAYRVTGSAFMLGLIAFSGQIPILLLAPVGGMLADRLDRRLLLAVIQVVAMAVAVCLGLLSYTAGFSAWALVIASAVLGMSSAVEMPTRQAFILQTVHDRSHATNAIALNSLAFNGARVVGPAVAGAVLALVGETACFALNAVSYLAAIYTLLAMRPRAVAANRRKGSLRESIQYLEHFAPARWLLIMVAAASFCVAPMMTFMPVYAKDTFHGGPGTLGMLMGASGLGAVLAGVYLANRTTVIGLGARIGASCLMIGVSALAFSYNPLFLVALPILLVSGASTILVITASNIVLQHLVPEHLRGRVMALFTMSFFGMLPLSALAAGALARVASVQLVFVVAGFGAIAVGQAFRRQLPRLQKLARPVLDGQGLLAP
ncbi:MAG TPA: MFS transporter [Burkholderiales bacterium]|nr:MFS transporter [Burkholderiales bacterium]